MNYDNEHLMKRGYILSISNVHIIVFFLYW